MQQHHTMTVTVSAGGEIKVDVVYKDRVPDLLSGFTADVQRLAKRFLWWPNAYERKLWRAARGMPFWARATIRQHILRERAERIQARLDARAEARRQRDLQRQAKLLAVRKVAEPRPILAAASTPQPVPVIDAPRPGFPVALPEPVALTRADEPVPATIPPSLLLGGGRHGAGSAWRVPVGCQRTLTQQLAEDHHVPQAVPWQVVTRGRGR